MPSSKLSMAPSSLLLFLVSSSVWVALPLSLMILRVVAADGPEREHCPPVLCGNVTVSFPFGLIPDGADQTHCGDGGIGSKVRCYDNSSLHLEYSRSDISMLILSIFYDNCSLHIVPRRFWHPYFNRSSCRIPAPDTFPVLLPPLFVSLVNQKLIFYNCTKPPPQGAGLVETVCHNNTFVRAADGRSDESGSYFFKGCTATKVPVLGVPGKVNVTNYEQLVRDGFLATWQPPPLPPPPESCVRLRPKVATDLALSRVFDNVSATAQQARHVVLEEGDEWICAGFTALSEFLIVADGH